MTQEQFDMAYDLITSLDAFGFEVDEMWRQFNEMKCSEERAKKYRILMVIVGDDDEKGEP